MTPTYRKIYHNNGQTTEIKEVVGFHPVKKETNPIQDGYDRRMLRKYWNSDMNQVARAIDFTRAMRGD